MGDYRHVGVPIGGGRDFYPDLAEVGKDFIEDEGICYDYAYPLEFSWSWMHGNYTDFRKDIIEAEDRNASDTGLAVSF